MDYSLPRFSNIHAYMSLSTYLHVGIYRNVSIWIFTIIYLYWHLFTHIYFRIGVKHFLPNISCIYYRVHIYKPAFHKHLKLCLEHSKRSINLSFVLLLFPHSSNICILFNFMVMFFPYWEIKLLLIFYSYSAAMSLPVLSRRLIPRNGVAKLKYIDILTF